MLLKAWMKPSLGFWKPSWLANSWRITSAKWFINDQLVDQSLSPTLLLNTPGNYSIRLEAKNEDGCLSVDIIEYIVVTEVTEIGIELTRGIYPNPVIKGGVFSIPGYNDLVQIYSISGQFQAELHPINGRFQLPNTIKEGLYILLMNNAVHTRAVKLIVDEP